MLINNDQRIMPKVSFQVGGCLDVPTSSLITGKKGETIIMGGVGPTMAVVGPGNTFKSKLIHFFALQLMSHFQSTTPIELSTYDSEVNVVLEQYAEMLERFDNLDDSVLYGEQWEVTDKANLHGNSWVENFVKYTEEKRKNKRAYVDYTALRDPFTKKVLRLPRLSIAVIDSLSDFEAESTQNLVEDIANDDSSVNMIDMQRGRFKNNFLAMLPVKTVSSLTYVFVTAKIGEKKDMSNGANKYAKIPKKLQHMDKSLYIKGVSPDFAYSMFAAWLAEGTSVLKNPSTKQPEYPVGKDDTVETDLNTIRLRMLRSKRGPSGYSIDVVVSQKFGVLPTLTEFHYIKKNGAFGIEGNPRNYNIVFYPEVNLSRTTIRSKIDDDSRLRRAIQIAAELHQLPLFHPHLVGQGLVCSPKELYDDIKKLGYDWNKLLDSRGYMLPDQYNKDAKPFLSTVDLMHMRKGLYKPYWYSLEKGKDDG